MKKLNPFNQRRIAYAAYNYVDKEDNCYTELEMYFNELIYDWEEKGNRLILKPYYILRVEHLDLESAIFLHYENIFLN